MFILIFFAAIFLPNIVIPVPTTETSIEQSSTEFRLPKLKCMHVTANIRNRYARTVVKSTYLNPENHTQDANFTITLPNSAFISGFIMYKQIGGKKEEIKREFQQAVESVSHDALRKRDSKIFTASVKLEPLSKVIFSLTYEQLLQRKNGKYEMIINLHPGQLVDKLKVDVNINETRRIVNIDTPLLRSGNETTEAIKVANNKFVKISKLNADETEVNINFSPSVQQQKEIMLDSKEADESEGISGQFVVEYDVERDPKGGEVIIDDGYFAHFFAPSDLKSIPKNIVFVIDSGMSMNMTRYKQLGDALILILKQLNNEDYFNYVRFYYRVETLTGSRLWRNTRNPPQFKVRQPYLATEDNIEKMIRPLKYKYNRSERAERNIYDALAVALHLTSEGVTSLAGTEIPMIVFLTDGDFNTEIQNYDEILKMVNSTNRSNKKRTAIFTLCFGNAENQEFLENVANENYGFKTTIYDTADASLQLEDFYKAISSPVLKDINFIYSDKISNVTNNKFDILFEGNEIIVAGKLNDFSDKFVSVKARSFNGTQTFVPNYYPIIKSPEPNKKRKYASMERLWAYMRIKQLLDKKDAISTHDEKKSPEEEALAIALKYSFVTPVSSLDVVQLNSTEYDDDEPCSEPDFSQGLLSTTIKPTIDGTGTPQTQIKPNNIPFAGSYYSNSNFLRFGGYWYSTTTSSLGFF